MTAYLAFEGFEQELAAELGGPKGPLVQNWGRLFLSEKSIQSVWAQDTWLETEMIEIASIGDAVKKLRSRQRQWVQLPYKWHRRSQLILEQLSTPRPLPLNFLSPVPAPTHGVYCLIDPKKILLSACPQARLPLGEVHFVEDKIHPPSRAYLKLWELFTLQGWHPQKGQRVVDLGSSPGGWTWVLQQLGCEVISVDKAPLAKSLKVLPRISTLKKDAFQLRPEDVGSVDWLFSDLICYPEKLWEYLQPWLKKPVSLVCTIKFQGPTNHEILKRFCTANDSFLVHLYHNKHEVTWVRLHGKPR